MAPTRTSALPSGKPPNNQEDHRKTDPSRPSCICSPINSLEYERSSSPKELGQFYGRVEVHAWESVFDQIHDEDSFHMDRIDYTVLEKDMNRNLKIVKRTSDATLGFLPTRGGFETEVQSPRGWIPLSWIFPTTEVPSDRDSDASSFVFPFAVYEAKRSSTSDSEAERQITHTYDRYLGLLDSIARDPRDPSKYQWRTSHEYQVFAFTSCASTWRVYVARRCGEYHANLTQHVEPYEMRSCHKHQ
ncbi:hypothetical protein F5Y11DRAFT_351789 [Daldinia sp. FL1419]|nr:hypothetical protein F5Y11DRAFT_351789 [Daldinia sp. FL1419]